MTFNAGIQAAIKEIEGWEALLVKAHDPSYYSNPKEAKREHDNTMRLLGVIKSKLNKKKISEPTQPADGQG